MLAPKNARRNKRLESAESSHEAHRPQPAGHRSVQVHDVAGPAARLPRPRLFTSSSAATSPPIRWPNCRTMSSAQLDHLCSLRFSRRRARVPAPAALHQERLRRLPAHLPLPAQVHHGRSRRARSCVITRARPADARDGLRDLRAGYIVNELYFRRFDRTPALEEGRARLQRARSPRCATSTHGAAARTIPSSSSTSACAAAFRGDWHDEVVATLAREAAAVLQGHLQRAAWRANTRWCRSAPWRTSTCRPSRLSACGCATSRRRRWRTGCRNTAATSASR